MALNKEDFTRNALERIKVANRFWDNWRTIAVDDYGFVSGNGQ